MLTGREDALYLVGQPATVTGRVAQKLGIVARAAEGVDMLALLGIMAVCRPFVGILHRYHSLQLVQFRRTHRVELFITDECILRKGDDIILRHAPGIRLRIEVLLQFRRQEIVEPGGFVGALSADEYQDDIVYGTFVYPSCYHRHEPFPEGFTEGHHGVSLHLYRGSEFGNIVLVAFLPGWEILQIIGEGIVGRAIVALDDIDHVALAHPCG